MTNIPNKGWLKAIRTSIGMSSRQLGKRLGISQQSAARLELNEVAESISLKTLRRAAKALDCKLVYQFVPREKKNNVEPN